MPTSIGSPRAWPSTPREAFLNLLTDPTRTADAFSPADHRRLRQVKAAWDPDNVFRLHHNIPPAGAEPSPAPTRSHP